MLPLLDLGVRYVGSPHFRVSSIGPTPSVDAATCKIRPRSSMSLFLNAGGYDLKTAVTVELLIVFITRSCSSQLG